MRARRCKGASGDLDIRCRRELKYHIGESKAAAIAQFIKPYLRLDRYCRLQPGGRYLVTSLYLDSDNLQLCRESLEGHKFSSDTDWQYQETKRPVQGAHDRGDP